MPPTLNTSTPSSSGHSNKNSIILVVALIILLGIVYFIFTSSKPSSQAPAAQNQGKTPQQTVTKEAIQVKTVNLNAAKTAADKLPAGFPAGIPIETANVTLSDSKVYTDRSPNIVVYTVDYQSDKTPGEKYDEYLTYMKQEGYTFGTNGQDTKSHALYGTKGASSLLVVSSTSNGKTVVQLSYTTPK